MWALHKGDEVLVILLLLYYIDDDIMKVVMSSRSLIHSREVSYVESSEVAKSYETKTYISPKYARQIVTFT